MSHFIQRTGLTVQRSNIHSAILKIAIPSILANITIPLVGLVDMIIAGHISSAWAIGGIAVGTMLFDMLYGCFGFLRVSTAGLTAQAYGADNPDECVHKKWRSSRARITIFVFGQHLLR